MKKSILALVFLCIALSPLQAQEISYGIMLGGNYKNLISESSSDPVLYDSYSHPKDAGIPTDLGVFIDYKIDESFGLKANLFYSKTFDSFHFDHTTEFNLKTSSLVVQPMFKYDVNQDYFSGFYLLVGPRLSFVLSAKTAEQELKVEDFYKGSNFGGSLGFGVAFSKIAGFEIIGDYGFSNILDSDSYEVKTISGYLNFYLNLAELINR